MSIQPSLKTAAAAGAWLALWAMPFERWMDKQALSPLQGNILFLGFALLFFLLPFYFLVLGRQAPFARNWMADPKERARYGVIAKRMVAWFLSAGVVLTIWSAIFPAAG